MILAHIILLGLAFYGFLWCIDKAAFGGTVLPNCVLTTQQSGTVIYGNRGYTPVAVVQEQPPQLQQNTTFANDYQCVSITRPGYICSWQSATCVYTKQ
jgi:hypothetical protein